MAVIGSSKGGLAGMSGLNTPKQVADYASAGPTPFHELNTGVGEVRDVEERLYKLMENLVGSQPPQEGAATVKELPMTGLMGHLAEQGRCLSRSAAAMSRYLAAIERALP